MIRLVNPRKRSAAALGLCAALVLLWATPAHGYAGPGAGFAILSSFWALFLAFLYSAHAMLSWPFRQFRRQVRRWKLGLKPRFQRIVILGFDGMDPDLAEKFMAEGKLPHLTRLRQTGSFRRLRTTFPAISPVAWSTFQTGVNPGKHNIYDFLARDRRTYLPFLSSAQIRGPKRRLRIAGRSVPVGRPQIQGLRRARPFWHWLADAGVFCSVIRVPVTFPPEKFEGVLLSGMCVPDLKGSQGTFCLCTTRAGADREWQGGVVVPMRRNGACLHSHVPGPDHPLEEKPGSELQLPFRVRLQGSGGAEFEVDSQRFSLNVGEYSEWIPVKFRAGLGFNAHGICRFWLKSVTPEVEVYVTPVNIDPAQPDLPVSHPLTYSIYLAKLLGPYATLGLAEDTWALNEEVLDDAAFLAQCYANHEDRERMLFDALEKTRRGVCACVFDTTDRVQHMFWRYLEDGGGAQPSRNVIPELYRRMDELVGRVMAQLQDNSLLLVVSDHGFKSFERGVNLNSWLHQNGYLFLKEGKQQSDVWFRDVDWSRTRAYTLGLNGLYLNLRGREHQGIVPDAESRALRAELRAKLEGLADPESGRTGITGVFDRETVFAGPYTEDAPDLVIGYGEGYRASWDAVTGKVTPRVFEPNTKAWSGDHCIDPRLVPGVLFSSHRTAVEDPGIVDVAPTMLQLFGLAVPAHMDGKPWTFAD